ncbi:MAG: LysR family transcriptional regulator [Proteobacteria bacterium]|nr:LysR family transcriptional regulator [Pseudomonadota bacterium]
MKYDIKDIITFTSIAKLKSFTKASEALNISKSVVTTRINDLEENLGVLLLVRTTREVNLTTDGQIFLNHCNAILQKVETLDDFLDSYKGINGTLKIVLPPYFSRYHIVPYLAEFLQQYQSLELDIKLTENPVNIIEEGFDLQVRIQIPEEENLEVAKLMANRKVVCASSDYLKKHSAPKTPQDLLGHNCIIFGENSVWKFKQKNKRRIIEIEDMKGNLKCDNGEIIKELVLAGVGITIKSVCDVENEIREKKLVVLLKDYEVVNETQFYAVYPVGRNTSPKIKAFVEFFQKKLLSKKI